jgi:hypothetical protein
MVSHARRHERVALRTAPTTHGIHLVDVHRVLALCVLALGASLLPNAQRQLVDPSHAARVSRRTPNAPQSTGPPQ